MYADSESEVHFIDNIQLAKLRKFYRKQFCVEFRTIVYLCLSIPERALCRQDWLFCKK